jgi:hypothetical protein
MRRQHDTESARGSNARCAWLQFCSLLQRHVARQVEASLHQHQEAHHAEHADDEESHEAAGHDPQPQVVVGINLYVRVGAQDQRETCFPQSSA